MTHKISVDFTGLCVFATKNVPDRLSVLLAGSPNKGMRHRPVLSFNVRNLKVFSGGSMVEVIQLPDGNQIASWDLDGKILTLEAGPNALPRNVRPCGGGVPKSRFPESPRDEMDLCWVPSLGRITGQDVNPAYLGRNPIQHHGESALSGRVDIDRGFLFANAAVNRLRPMECWTIQTVSGPALEQYLADTVRLEIDGQDGELLTITAVPFGGGKAESERLELEPQEGQIALSITNLPVVLPDHELESATMDHFVAYYGLLAGGLKKPLIPRRGDQRDMPPPPAGHTMGPDTARAEGVYPVKCAPGMVP